MYLGFLNYKLNNCFKSIFVFSKHRDLYFIKYKSTFINSKLTVEDILFNIFL